MAVVTAEKLSSTVGAEVIGVDGDRLLDDDALPAWTLEALEAHGALVFRGLHIDDATQVAFCKKLGRVEVFGRGSTRRSSGSPSTRPRTRRPPTCGAPSTGTSTAAPTTSRSWPPSSAPTPWRSRAARPSSPAPTAPSTTCPTRRRSAASRCGSSTPRGGAAPAEQRPLTRGAGPVAWPSLQGASAGVDPPIGAALAGAGGHHVARRGDGRRRGRAAAGRPPGPVHHTRAGVPAPVGGRRHGDLGQPGRAAPGLPVRRRLARDMHRTTLHGDEVIQ